MHLVLVARREDRLNRLARSSVDLEHRYSPSGLTALQGETRNDPVIGKSMPNWVLVEPEGVEDDPRMSAASRLLFQLNPIIEFCRHTTEVRKP